MNFGAWVMSHADLFLILQEKTMHQIGSEFTQVSEWKFWYPILFLILPRQAKRYLPFQECLTQYEINRALRSP